MERKKLTLAALVGITAVLTLGTLAHAATAEQKAAAKQKWESMTPEEKAEAKKKMEAKWDSMTPEEQAAAKKRFGEKHPRGAAKAAEKAAASAPK